MLHQIFTTNVMMGCNVAEFSTLLSRYGERTYTMKSPLFGSEEENPSPQRSGSLVFLYYLLIFYLFIFFVCYLYFSCERKLWDE